MYIEAMKLPASRHESEKNVVAFIDKIWLVGEFARIFDIERLNMVSNMTPRWKCRCWHTGSTRWAMNVLDMLKYLDMQNRKEDKAKLDIPKFCYSLVKDGTMNMPYYDLVLATTCIYPSYWRAAGIHPCWNHRLQCLVSQTDLAGFGTVGKYREKRWGEITDRGAGYTAPDYNHSKWQTASREDGVAISRYTNRKK